MIKFDLKKVKEHIGFNYLFTEIQLYTDSFGIKYIPQEVLKKTEINKFLTMYLEYKMMILLSKSIGFIVSLSQIICLQENLY